MGAKMIKWFNNAAPVALSEAECALRDWGIKYQKNPDGSILVPGDLVISGLKLKQLPDLSSVEVLGHFNCSDNALKSLIGCPQGHAGVGGRVVLLLLQRPHLSGVCAAVGR